MPRVGDKHFDYDLEGRKAAEAYSEKTGLPVEDDTKDELFPAKRKPLTDEQIEATVGRMEADGEGEGMHEGGTVKADRGNGIARQGIRACKMV
tara:strand:- start:2134 stop:2412 length:279 start_codon:yes stop_codon:yes gene_type:complete